MTMHELCHLFLAVNRQPRHCSRDSITAAMHADVQLLQQPKNGTLRKYKNAMQDRLLCWASKQGYPSPRVSR